MEYWKNLTVYTKELSESFVAVAVAIAAGKILHLILTFFSIHVGTATIKFTLIHRTKRLSVTKKCILLNLLMNLSPDRQKVENNYL